MCAIARTALLTTAVILFAAMTPSGAQDSDGELKDKLIEALTAAATGSCPEAIMSPMLLDACEQQASQNRRILAPLGPIARATYRGEQDMNGEMAGAYRVEFERGTMTWYASLDRSGRLKILWSNGQVRSN
jgi:hypothetical protein